MIVVTAKPTVCAERVIAHLDLGKCFYRIYGSELDGTGSNKTELIRHVLVQEQLSPRETLMVGDRHHNIIGAKANGLLSAGVLWDYGSREELSACKPDILVDTLIVLTEALGRIYFYTFLSPSKRAMIRSTTEPFANLLW